MNKNQSYYIQSWSKHVANQRLLIAIPDFNLVLGRKNVLEENYEAAIKTYKARLSHAHALAKGFASSKNSYLSFVNKLLEEKLGFRMAITLNAIKKHIISQEPQKLQKQIQIFENLLKKDPTLISILPNEIILFIRAAKITKKVLSNIIYVTKRHRFSKCYSCGKQVSGKECSILKCLCSTKIFHNQCASVAGKRCYICAGIHSSINSSQKNKTKDDKNFRDTIIKREACSTEKGIVQVKSPEKKGTYGISKHKSCTIVNNATLWDDRVC